MIDPDISLFDPIRVGALHLPNRIVMAPMTRNRAGDGLAPTPLNAEYYRQRASAGLIVTEATQVSPQGIGYPFTPGIYSRGQIEGWRSVVEAVHGAGGLVFLQLWHVGRISHPDLLPDGRLPVAPSAVRPAGQAFTYKGLKPFEAPRALETAEVTGIVEEFAQGARLALNAGLDGVEIHAANGYLIDQFLRDGTNRRMDRYGGSIANRCRMLDEITRAVCEVWGADRVGVRISPAGAFNDMSDSDPEALFLYAAEMLNAFDLAYLHVVETHEAPQPFPFSRLRRTFRGPYMANGGYTKDRAEEAIRTGRADLVSFGRPFLANPDLPARFSANAPLNEADPSTFYGGKEKGYTDYPALQ